MKTVLLRKRYAFDDVPEDYRFVKTIIEPFPFFYKEIDILVTDSRSLKIMAEDIIQARIINPECRIIVLAEKGKESLVSSLFPNIEFPFSDVPLAFEGIITGRSTYKKSYKKISLNNKEEDLLEAMSYGMTQKDISQLLGMSQRTIRRTQTKLLQKTGLENIKQLGIYAFAENWLSLND